MARLILVLMLAAGARAEEPKDWRLVIEHGTERVALNPADGTKADLKVGTAAEPDGTVKGLRNVWHAASPDGKRIVYQMQAMTAPRHSVIVVADSDGKNFRTLMESHDNVRPAWSADGKSIIFASNRQNESWHVYRIDADGRNEKRLSREAVDHNCWPCFAADGRAIFSIDRGRQGKLPIMNLVLTDGEKDEVLVKDNYVIATAISPDHKKLAVATPEELIIRDLKAETSRKIAIGDVNANWVVVFHGALWRPDGQALAVTFGFLGGRMAGAKVPGEDHIGVIELDGEKPKIQTYPVGTGFGLKAWITAADLNRGK